ncbi:A disintegrin and metalloproteinase with thrombospondin motifs adt-2-like [Saccostrea echinata]|uniref:A disintegrin and metalloproteinase with thrombospondin motifs adt-2-like n=1 Tax=Saccostrea echinata TaxID=191078 RepID=UPI002A8334F7|nr:A disintegrin and metalloproteinase with thrombospondin motifs adt-2-like [Saccostrea echinata]
MAIHPTVLILVVSLSSLSLAVDVETFVKMQTTFEIWGSWSSCSGLCGIQGTRYRTRGCHHWIMGFMRFSTECPMYGRETQTCQVVCLQSKTTTSSAGDWGPWGQYSACDKTCGGGLRIRYRACRIGSCVGDSLQSSLCNAQHCPASTTIPSTSTTTTAAPTTTTNWWITLTTSLKQVHMVTVRR